MASTEVEVLTPTDGPKLHTILHKPSSKKLMEEKNKENECGHLTRKCFGEDVKPSAGMCLIAFGVPLLLPGITLTAVAFDDETGFSKYGALHILGMIMLGVAALLIIIGIALNIRFKSRVGPEDRLHTLSTHEKTNNDLDNQKHFIRGENNEDHNGPRDSKTGAHLNNFMVEAGHNEAGGDHHVHFMTSQVGTASFTDAVDASRLSVRRDQGWGYTREKDHATTTSDDISSSYDSSDSDDFSSGSYVISEDVEVSEEGEFTATSGIKSAHNLTSSDSQLANREEPKRTGSKKVKSVSKKTRPSSCHAGIKLEGHSNKETALSNNFFRESTDSVTSVNEVQNISRAPTTKLPTTPQQGRRKERELKRNTSDNLSPQIFTIGSRTSNSSAEVSPTVLTDQYSPGSRQRLQALRSDVLLSDQSDTPCDITTTNFDINNFGSNASVFSGEEDQSTIAVVSKDDTFTNNSMLPNRRSDPIPSWTESANGTLPRLQKHARLSESTGAIKDKTTLSELHISRTSPKPINSPK